MSKREIMQLTLNDVQKAFTKVEELINEPNSRLLSWEHCIKQLFDLEAELRASYVTGKEGGLKKVSDTLLTKIIMGTLGCTVAYDNNVRIILSATGIASAKFDDDSIKSLCEYYMQNRVDFERLRKKVEERTKKNCPPFKLLDLILYSAANMDSSDGSEE